VRQIGIVDLQDQAGIDDGLVFVAQRFGDGKDIILVAFCNIRPCDRARRSRARPRP
jgi:hypothetical protein